MSFSWEMNVPYTLDQVRKQQLLGPAAALSLQRVRLPPGSPCFHCLVACWHQVLLDCFSCGLRPLPGKLPLLALLCALQDPVEFVKKVAAPYWGTQ